MNRVRLAFLGARVIEIIVALHRRRYICFLNTAKDFAIKVRLQRFGGRHYLLGVSIFSFEVVNDVRIGAVAQPEVIVDAPVAVTRDFRRDGLSNRGNYWLSSFPIYNSLTSSR